ncbi:hypothetical protein M513_12039 [Trichuris suis]|uniref:Uncharacterized protein n=1 Tax=Trichuris suis TaxID=68888 RepID=A0A085LQ05_9BILA|nr:hypothetical protein M513_12039 [Trichuris suis]
MKVDSDKQFLLARLGAAVRVPVPDVDRGRGDARNLLAVVMSVRENGFYRLGTAQGVVNQLYARSGFTPCRKELIRIEDVKKYLFDQLLLLSPQEVARVS